jgi:hypothetical protein
MPMVANKKAPVLSDTRAKKIEAVANADCASFQPAVQALCPRCALFIPKKSQHGKNVCRWTGEVLTATTMPLCCCGYTVEVVHG